MVLGLHSTRNFMAYMIQNAIYLEEVEMNCKEEEELIKVNLFLSRRGLIIETIKIRKLIYIAIPTETLIDYQVASSEIINEIILKNVFYPWDKKKNVIITLMSEKTLFSVANTLDRFNQKRKASG